MEIIMKKFFIAFCFVLTILLHLHSIVFADNEITEIECKINSQMKRVYNNQILNESFYVQKYRIDDVNQKLFVYSMGQEGYIWGDYSIFNKDEIVIENSKLDKNTVQHCKIDRRSGTIFIKTITKDRWWGDVETTQYGSCSKLDSSNAKF